MKKNRHPPMSAQDVPASASTMKALDPATCVGIEPLLAAGGSSLTGMALVREV
jgi:hypothetical protein